MTSKLGTSLSTRAYYFWMCIYACAQAIAGKFKHIQNIQYITRVDLYWCTLTDFNPETPACRWDWPLGKLPHWRRASTQQLVFSPSAHQVKPGDSHSDNEVRPQSQQVSTLPLWLLPNPGVCRADHLCCHSSSKPIPSSREGWWIQAHSLSSVPEMRLLNLAPEYRKLFCSLLLIASRTVSYLSSLQNFSDTFQGRLQPLHLQPLVCLGCRWSADGSNWLHGYR